MMTSRPESQATVEAAIAEARATIERFIAHATEHGPVAAMKKFGYAAIVAETLIIMLNWDTTPKKASEYAIDALLSENYFFNHKFTMKAEREAIRRVISMCEDLR
jgi:hypothetical protein